MSFVAWTALLALISALACALPGVFVVLRRSSMLTDAIGHAVLPGIVIGYAITHDLKSPLLMLGAALSGLLVVIGNEYLVSTGLLSGDAAQGLIFPALFSIGVILVTSNFAHVHLDVHVVLIGDLNLVAFDQLEIGGTNFGPTYFWVLLAIFALNALFIAVFWSEMKISTFDPVFAETIGIKVRALNMAFMFLVSLTITAAFNTSGAVLVIALMIAPPACAHLLTTRLSAMIGITLLIASVGSLGGFWLAYELDAATSAGMALFYVVIFLGVFGYSRYALRRRQTKISAKENLSAVMRPNRLEQLA